MRVTREWAPARGPSLPLEQNPKNFDFVVYGTGLNLLVEIKGRKLAGTGRRLESWVNAEDVRSMLAWEHLFGPEFRAVFLFLYWCDELPADGLFEEIVQHKDRWYALRVVSVAEYAAHMRERSPRWGTVHVDARSFARISHPFRGSAGPAGGSTGGIGCPAPAMEPIGA